jgi:hypothetical protein
MKNNLTIDDIKKLEAVIFALETVAHLQGKEKLLLPMCDDAREIIEKVKKQL